jgi:large conductance mechanosensitive channel
VLKEFREFILRGNMVDMAVGITVGTAFGALVGSLVNDLIMPPVGLLLSGVDFADFFVVLKAGSPGGPYATLADAQSAGAVTINYGAFANTLVSFLVISLAIFLIVRFVNRLRRSEREKAEAPATKECPYCLSAVPMGATRCAHCTADLVGV